MIGNKVGIAECRPEIRGLRLSLFYRRTLRILLFRWHEIINFYGRKPSEKMR